MKVEDFKIIAKSIYSDVYDFLIKKYNKKYFTLDDMTELSAELKIKTVNFLFGAENLNIVKFTYRDKHNNIIDRKEGDQLFIQSLKGTPPEKEEAIKKLNEIYLYWEILEPQYFIND
jgi:hypothetical protein